MGDWLAFINSQQGAITALATVVIAVAAVVTAVVTFNLVRENKLLRKAGTDPQIVAYLMSDQRYKSMVNFVLANVGQGPARNVSFKIDADLEDFTQHEVEISNNADRKAISILPQAERFVTFFGVGQKLFKEPRLRPFTVRVAYEDLHGIVQEGEFHLDIAEFEGLINLGSPAEHEIAEAMKKIERHLSELSESVRSLEIHTISAVEETNEHDA